RRDARVWGLTPSEPWGGAFAGPVRQPGRAKHPVGRRGSPCVSLIEAGDILRAMTGAETSRPRRPGPSPEALARALMEDAETGVLLLDPDARLRRINRPALRLLSLRPSQARGAHASRLLRLSRDRKSTRLNSSHQIISYA